MNIPDTKPSPEVIEIMHCTSIVEDVKERLEERATKSSGNNVARFIAEGGKFTLEIGLEKIGGTSNSFYLHASQVLKYAGMAETTWNLAKALHEIVMRAKRKRIAEKYLAYLHIPTEQNLQEWIKAEEEENLYQGMFFDPWCVYEQYYADILRSFFVLRHSPQVKNDTATYKHLTILESRVMTSLCVPFLPRLWHRNNCLLRTPELMALNMLAFAIQRGIANWEVIDNFLKIDLKARNQERSKGLLVGLCESAFQAVFESNLLRVSDIPTVDLILYQKNADAWLSELIKKLPHLVNDSIKNICSKNYLNAYRDNLNEAFDFSNLICHKVAELETTRATITDYLRSRATHVRSKALWLKT